ncbi:MAG: hypothetical protein JXR76_08160, partial [Deltaproteobacteria bacterium]|nr:hypothetical protein [Deltaproteobacteria bacterium]
PGRKLVAAADKLPPYNFFLSISTLRLPWAFQLKICGFVFEIFAGQVRYWSVPAENGGVPCYFCFFPDTNQGVPIHLFAVPAQNGGVPHENFCFLITTGGAPAENPGVPGRFPDVLMQNRQFLIQVLAVP